MKKGLVKTLKPVINASCCSTNLSHRLGIMILIAEEEEAVDGVVETGTITEHLNIKTDNRIQQVVKLKK